MNAQSPIDQSVLIANPNDWLERKKIAVQMYKNELYLEAADLVWNAPEIPSTDLDVAFTIKIVSRARANRAIRLVYEVMKRNQTKPQKNIAFAKALNLIGLPMLASRFYGAALAVDDQCFDLGFEQQSMWLDESESLLEQWANSNQEVEQPFRLSLEQSCDEPVELAKLVRDHGLSTEPLKTAPPKKVKPSLKPARPTASTVAQPAAPRPTVGRPPVAVPVSATGPLRPAVPMTGPMGAQPVAARTSSNPQSVTPAGSETAELKRPPKPMLPPVAPPA